MKRIAAILIVFMVLTLPLLYAEDGVYRGTVDPPMSATLLKIQEKVDRLEAMIKEMVEQQKALQAQMEEEHKQIRYWINRR